MRGALVVGAAMIAFALPARAEPEARERRLPFQAGAHGGGECFDGCEQSFPAIGFDLFWTPGRVVALGLVLAEYIHTAGPDRTGTVRVGPAVRFYFSRGGLIEPHLGLALGAASFQDDSPRSCTKTAGLFAQLSGGADLRITRAFFLGAAVTGTAQGYGTSCLLDDSSATDDDGTWNTGPSAAALLTVRLGPLVDW